MDQRGGFALGLGKAALAEGTRPTARPLPAAGLHLLALLLSSRAPARTLAFWGGLRHGRVDSEGTAGPGASLPRVGPPGRAGRGRETQRWVLEGGKDHRKWFESGEKIFQHSQMLTLGREKEPISEKWYVLCFLQSIWNRKQLV